MISIIIPMYNSVRFLDLLVESLINQIDKDFEVIFIDDGSTDKTISELENLLVGINLDYVIIAQDNCGQSVARNRGLLNSNGKYVCFIDSDDIMEPNYIALANNLIRKHDLVDSLIMGFRAVKENELGKISKSKLRLVEYIDDRNSKLAFIKSFLTKKIKIHNSAIVYSKNFLLKNKLFFDEKLRFGEDSIFLLEALLISNILLFTRAVTYNYMSRENSVIKTAPLYKIYAFLESLNSLTEIKRTLIGDSLSRVIQNNYSISSAKTIAKYYKFQDYLEFVMKLELRYIKLDDVAGYKFIFILAIIKLLGPRSYFVLGIL